MPPALPVAPVVVVAAGLHPSSTLVQTRRGPVQAAASVHFHGTPTHRAPAKTL